MNTLLHTSDPVDAPVLEMRGISKTFQGVKALQDVSLTAFPGEVHALMGENGAGKSTLMKILSGVYRADQGGEILINGGQVEIRSPGMAQQLGISTIHQELSLAPNLTVIQNMMLGREKKWVSWSRGGSGRAACEQVLRDLGAQFGGNAVVGSLSMADRQQVEIARALLTKSRILVMDEPTTSLSSRETDRLFEIIDQLRRVSIGLIYISHRMDEIYALADRVTVLRDGQSVGTLEKAEISSKKLVSMMVGRDLSSFYIKDHKAPASQQQNILEVSGLSDGGYIEPATFSLRRNEVLGIAGLVGSGRTELARLICGADISASGDVRLDGVSLAGKSLRKRMDAGIVYLTEDRKSLGIMPNMSVAKNINLCVVARDSLGPGVLNRAAGKRRAIAAMSRLRVKAASERLQITALSGGNQQKALVARLLELEPKVIILDEPTRGIDIGAKMEIYQLIDKLAEAGIGIVVISSELPELIGIADRILVMRDGKIVGQSDPLLDLQSKQEQIAAMATGNEVDHFDAAVNVE